MNGLQRRTTVVLAATVILLTVATALARGTGADLSWHTMDGGGGTSTGGEFELSGTIGQPDAGVMTGGTFTLGGGFWGGGAITLPCPSDVNGDGDVAVNDLLDLLAAWGNPGPTDLDGNGTTDVVDLLAMLGNWGPCP